eukprot:CAMPEP_0172752788 /NCGR_PEP_ID=MMETSP1074-20121228/154569_1 /TAXON_ID=2916 /ORGANISM="Ceratium fusus, Strain PA161109" /LENGTH=80 /DNA_ID=CAMNT_0013585337 /DNA_START=42 /DNA_END=281 /DNA_ORIENTATION=+
MKSLWDIAHSARGGGSQTGQQQVAESLQPGAEGLAFAGEPLVLTARLNLASNRHWSCSAPSTGPPPTAGPRSMPLHRCSA